MPETVFAAFADAFAVNTAVVPIICVVLFGCCVNAALTFTFLWGAEGDASGAGVDPAGIDPILA